MSTAKIKALKYAARDKTRLRKYYRGGKVEREEKQVYHKNGKVSSRRSGGGSGHRAGENWGEAKKIDPDSKERIYSRKGKSPSFDQGVRNYKTKAHNKALSEARLDKFFHK